MRARRRVKGIYTGMEITRGRIYRRNLKAKKPFILKVEKKSERETLEEWKLLGIYRRFEVTRWTTEGWKLPETDFIGGL